MFYYNCYHMQDFLPPILCPHREGLVFSRFYRTLCGFFLSLGVTNSLGVQRVHNCVCREVASLCKFGALLTCLL